MVRYLICSGLSAVLGLAVGAAEPRRFESGPVRVSLVELFTSEGCSSCPPAEKWLGSLRADPDLWRTFVPVAWHVNYWDRLGWPDRFASRAATQRQHAYAAAWGSGTVYTPGFVRDGAEWRPHDRKVAPASGAAPGRLAARYDGTMLVADYAPAPSGAGGRYEIHAALLGGGIVSKVAAGENSGATLRHEFVVLAQVQGAPGETLPLNAPDVAGVPDRAIAVWVTRRGELAPLQATGGWISF